MTKVKNRRIGDQEGVGIIRHSSLSRHSPSSCSRAGGDDPGDRQPRGGAFCNKRGTAEQTIKEGKLAEGREIVGLAEEHLPGNRLAPVIFYSRLRDRWRAILWRR